MRSCSQQDSTMLNARQIFTKDNERWPRNIMDCLKVNNNTDECRLNGFKVGRLCTLLKSRREANSIKITHLSYKYSSSQLHIVYDFQNTEKMWNNLFWSTVTIIRSVSTYRESLLQYIKQMFVHIQTRHQAFRQLMFD